MRAAHSLVPRCCRPRTHMAADGGEKDAMMVDVAGMAEHSFEAADFAKL